jgi:hypothetical protein
MTNTDPIKPATTHTPGTWTLSHDAEGVFTIHAKGNNKAPARIAIVTSFKDDLAEISEAEAASNGRLIAAAPELFEALVDLFNWLTPDWQQSSLGDKANAAIAKAKGGAQ